MQAADKTVLIVGASGVIGEAAVDHFARLPDWRVTALSRRPPHAPDLPVRHLAVDLTDADACRAACAGLSKVTHVVYAAVSESAGLVEGWRDTGRMAVNLAMLENLMEPLSAAAPGLAHVALLQGAKAYGAHAGHLVPLPALEDAPRVQHENFYWLQEDYIRAKAAGQGFAWTIFRPCVVVGGAWGAAMNPMLALGAYAALRREEGRGFAYLGGALQVTEIVGADLIAEALAWAAGSPAAAGQIFNITDGEVFAWRDAWPALAELYGMAAGEDEPMSLAAYFADREALWERIVAREGLRPLSLQRLLGESHHYMDILLRRDATATGRPNLLSTVKLRQAGFPGCRHSRDTLRRWAGELVERRLLPNP